MLVHTGFFIREDALLERKLPRGSAAKPRIKTKPPVASGGIRKRMKMKLAQRSKSGQRGRDPGVIDGHLVEEYVAVSSNDLSKSFAQPIDFELTSGYYMCRTGHTHDTRPI